MKATICLILMVFVFACCKSKEKLMTSGSGNLTGQQVDIVVKEDVKDTLTIDLSTVPPRPENVTLTHGDVMARYCVIVGSFMYKENAEKLRGKLAEIGFLGVCIMQNKQGMYRVAATCNNEQPEAQRSLWNIRRHYPQFIDAWLLEVKNE